MKYQHLFFDLDHTLWDFETNAKNLTQQKGYDVAVCGHIHLPKIEETYMNSGDFCENSTCLVEDKKGNWKILTI
jgi:predicted phosphodiesterase